MREDVKKKYFPTDWPPRHETWRITCESIRLHRRIWKRFDFPVRRSDRPLERPEDEKSEPRKSCGPALLPIAGACRFALAACHHRRDFCAQCKPDCPRRSGFDGPPSGFHMAGQRMIPLDYSTPLRARSSVMHVSSSRLQRTRPPRSAWRFYSAIRTASSGCEKHKSNLTTALLAGATRQLGGRALRVARSSVEIPI
jgi:hypothetical protein